MSTQKMLTEQDSSITCKLLLGTLRNEIKTDHAAFSSRGV